MLENWIGDLDYMYNNVPHGVFNIVFHPQVSNRKRAQDARFGDSAHLRQGKRQYMVCKRWKMLPGRVILIMGQKKSNGTIKNRIVDLERRYIQLFRAAEFGIAGAIGFLVSEGIIALGILVLYGKVNIPGSTFSSLSLIVVNAVAFAIGVTVAFFVNEAVTVRSREKTGKRKARNGVIIPILIRLGKFQLVYLLGNIITIGVELGLLGEFYISPLLGNVAGAIAAYPVTYLISMRYVWKVRRGRRNGSRVKSISSSSKNPNKEEVGDANSTTQRNATP
jgi:putative flippase GtrA